MIYYATIKDLEEIDELAVRVITDMKDAKIPQWELSYPRKDHFLKDVLKNGLIIYKEDTILGCMAILPENDPPYQTINSWQKEKSIVLHRILVDPNTRGKGIAQKMLDFAIALGIREQYESIKIDTHLENYKMISFLEKNGFIRGDYIESINRIAYEKLLEE